MVDSATLTALAAELLAALEVDLGPRAEHGSTAFARARELEALAAGAKPVPFTRLVRVDREAVYEICDAIRSGLPEEIGPARQEPPAARAADATRISLTEAAARFSELAHRARFADERFLVELDGVPMVEIRSAGGE